MHPGKSQSEHIDEFYKLVGDLVAIDTAISDEDQTLLLLTSLPSSYDNFMETLLYGRDTLKLEDVLTTLNSKELQKMKETKGDGGEGLYVRGSSGQRDMEQGTDSAWSKSEGRSSRLRSDGYDSADVMMAMSVEELLDWIMDSGASYHITYMRGKVQLQMRDGSSYVLDNVRYVPELRRNLISLGTLEKEGFTVTMQSGKIKRSTQQCMKRGVAKHLDVARIQQQNELVEETNMTLVAKVVLYKNTGFNESGKYKKTFIGSGVGTGSVQVLQGVEFEVEPQEDHAFEVEPLRNVDQRAGSHKVQTQDLIYYHSAHDREQHSAWELFSYREDSNEAAFAVVTVDKIFAHESLTFNNTVACEVISMWKARLKDDVDARSNVYVLSNGYRKCSAAAMAITGSIHHAEIWATKGLLDKAKGNVLGVRNTKVSVSSIDKQR
ncbi:hypothetical protein Tco_0881480 [Tanacetum coccineum]